MSPVGEGKLATIAQAGSLWALSVAARSSFVDTGRSSDGSGSLAAPAGPNLPIAVAGPALAAQPDPRMAPPGLADPRVQPSSPSAPVSSGGPGGQPVTSLWLASARVRQAVSALVLPVPEAVPLGTLSAPAGLHADWTVLRTLAGAAAQAARHHDWDDVAALARGALQHLPPLAPHWLARPPLDLRDSADPHDAFFRIVRSNDRVAPAYLRGQVQAVLVFLQEADTAAARAAYAAIGQALTQLWSAGLGTDARLSLVATAPAPAVQNEAMQDDQATAPAASGAPSTRPLQRWLRGQQLFAALAQGLVWTLQSLPQHVEAADRDALGASLRRAARLHRASAQALAFMVDFHPRHFADTLRPAMRVPHVPAGFCGSLSADHRHLMALRAQLAPALRMAQQLCQEDHARMEQALAQAQVSNRLLWRRLIAGDHPAAA